MSWSEIKVLALEVSCDFCNADPGEPCLTRTGRRARHLHWSRLWLMQRAWSVGYGDASLDYARSYLNEPEWFDRWARRQITEANNTERNH